MKPVKIKSGAWLLILVVAVSFFQYDYRAVKRNFSDFHVPYVTAKRLLNNEEIYTFKGGLSYYKYPLLYAFLMAPLTYLSERNAARIWFLLNIIFLLVIFYASRKIIEEGSGSYPVARLYFFTIIVCFRFILQNLHEGQANVFMLALLLSGLYYILNNKETLGSIFLAGSIMIKYMPVLFLPYFLFKKRYSLVSKVLLFIVLLTFIPAMGIGLERTVILLKQQLSFLFPSAMDDYSVACYPNQSLLACLSRFFYEKSWFQVKMLNLSREWVLFLFFSSAAALYTLALISKGKDRFSQVIDFAMISLCMPLFNPNAWRNFFVLIIFAYMLVIYYLIRIAGNDRWVLALLLISFALNSLTSEFFTYKWAEYTFDIYSAVTFGTLALFAALVKLKFYEKTG